MKWAGTVALAWLQWSAEKGFITTAEELHYLQQIVDREARGEGLKGQTLVANVVLNHVNNPQFPDSIIEVIKQSRLNDDGSVTWQFTPAGRPDFGTAAPSEMTIEAVRLALSDVDYSQGALYFHAISHITAIHGMKGR